MSLDARYCYHISVHPSVHLWHWWSTPVQFSISKYIVLHMIVMCQDFRGQILQFWVSWQRKELNKGIPVSSDNLTPIRHDNLETVWDRTYEIVLFTHRKSHTGFWQVPRRWPWMARWPSVHVISHKTVWSALKLWPVLTDVLWFQCRF